MIQSLIYGFSLPIQSARLILKNKKLLIWSMIPILITIVLYYFGLIHIQSMIQDWVSSTLQAWGWQSWIINVISWLSKLMVFFISALTFSFVSNILSAPFNDFLAESAEPFTTPPLASVGKQSIGMKIQLVGIDLVKTFSSMLFALLAVLLSWIPILNFVGFGIVFLIMTFQYISYPQTRRGMTLKQGTVFLRKNLIVSLSFGASLSFLFSIPFLSVLVVPLAVVGGTLLVAKYSDFKIN